ncbi:MAG: Gfo/Idh/MocA family oxidoreductase [Dehalococcoidia bacterium]
MPIGWAIVSTGRHPDAKMAPAINAAEGSAIAAVVSRDRERAAAFAEKHKAARAYDNMEDMLRDAAVEVVYVASPNALHKEQVLQAAAAGKHVLVEKPMALTVADCQAMVDACSAAGVQLGVGFHLRSHPGHQRLRDLVRDGKLGAVSYAEANWGRGTRGQVSPPPRPAQQAWWGDPKLAGAGAFMATGVHCADTLRFVLGREAVEVHALTDATPEQPLEEMLTLAMRMDDGSLATVLTGRRTPDYERNDVVVYGSEGRGGVHGSMDTTRTGSLAVRTAATAEDQSYDQDPIALYTLQVDAFNTAVTNGTRPLATGLDGLRVAQITVAMVESSQTGRRVRLE